MFSLAQSGPAEGASPVVAVFTLQSLDAPIADRDLETLTDYLRSALTESQRFEVIPRDDLVAFLRKQKKDSYKECYDESCQIEVGKELAAAKSVAGTISKFADTCIVNLKLFDIKKSTQEAAGTSTGECALNSIFDSLRTAATKLIGKRSAPSVKSDRPALPGGAAATGPVSPDRPAPADAQPAPAIVQRESESTESTLQPDGHVDANPGPVIEMHPGPTADAHPAPDEDPTSSMLKDSRLSSSPAPKPSPPVQRRRGITAEELEAALDADERASRWALLYTCPSHVTGPTLIGWCDDGTLYGLLHMGILAFASAEEEAYNLLGLSVASWIADDSFSLLRVGVYNGSGADAAGVQLAVVNSVGEDLEGIAIGVVNAVDDEVYGFQLLGINYAEDDVTGGQLGVGNFSSRDLTGVQVGAINWVDDQAVGIQAGVINLAEDMYGIQAGLLNYTEDNQAIAVGIINIAGDLAGIQAGLINIVTDDVDGVQLGVLNIGEGRVRPILNF